MIEAHVFCPLPQVLSSPLESGVIKKARDCNGLRVFVHDLHEFSPDRHRNIDDAPFGGGPGMVIRVDVIANALSKVFEMSPFLVREKLPVILLSPRGEKFDQEKAKELSRNKHFALICGRYEGIDERVREHFASFEISIGDYVLSGGELAALVILDAVSRLIPGVLGNYESLGEESFSGPCLEYPQFTRPSDFKGLKVPRVLLSGDHKRIREWRKTCAREITQKRRPDLLV
ncbi:MAG: tRNA (guanosine(37)-N1)-methyltransferase TrmD [Actinomycetota bacterium]|nr:tRNA (guanosine(37)-N1)-methyltransferase TrmD [Actinomycetota bacterium]